MRKRNRSSDGTRVKRANVNEWVSGRDPDIAPFHRKRIIDAGWALLIAAIGWGASIAWQRHQGPERVMVINQDTTAHVTVVADTAQRALMARMLGEMRAFRINSASRSDASGNVRLDVGSVASSDEPSPNPLQLPAFAMPSTVKGYLLSDLGALAESSCPVHEIPRGQRAAATLALRNAADTSRLTPIQVNILHKSSATGVVQVFSQEYKLRAKSLLVVPVPQTPGTYTLEFGVYALAELNTIYPPFYRRACEITVV